MSYYLLTFNEDWADEHDVPALECFTEKEYNNWLSKEFGELNSTYEQELANYKAYQKARNKMLNEIKSILGKNWEYIPYDKWPKDLHTKYDNLPSIFNYNSAWPNPPNKVLNHTLHAHLGNNGEYFNRNFLNCFNGQDFIDNNYVLVSIVTEEFYNIFKENKLSRLSLCNIFND